MLVFFCYCQKYSKILFLQQHFSIVKTTMPLRCSPFIFKSTSPLLSGKFTKLPIGHPPHWSPSSKKTLCLERSTQRSQRVAEGFSWMSWTSREDCRYKNSPEKSGGLLSKMSGEGSDDSFSSCDLMKGRMTIFLSG